MEKETIELPKKAYVREHKRLIKVLRSGTAAERKREAKRQERDLQAAAKQTEEDD